jgi:hypothetical protein
MFTPHLRRTATATIGGCRLVSLAFSVAAALLLSTGAHAGFIDTYPFGSFTLVNTDADGVVEATLGGLPFVITGGNTGSGESGTTDFVTEALGPGLIVFGFSFESPDDRPYESAGYLLRGMYYELTNAGSVVGTAEFPVSAGDVFGWRVFTLDNQGEPGVLRVDDGSAPVPEPSMFLATFAVIVLAAALRLSRRGRNHIRRA